MNPRNVFWLLVALCALFPSLGTAQAAAPASGASITFMVLGDPQPEEPPDVEPQAFNAMIREAEVLKPDCMLIVGDVIRGFTDDRATIDKEWNGFEAAVRSIRVPLLVTAGNHDIWDGPSQQAYAKRMGGLFRSVDVGPAHFILLNSSVVGEASKIGPKQLEWLKRDLEQHQRAPFIFVSVHIPLWAYGKQSNWMTDVHPLLKRYGVRAVFAGHWHIYQRSNVLDGIRYYVTGGAGGMMAGSDMQAGDFSHYMLVRAKGNDVSYAVVQPGAVHADSVVTQESSQLVNRLRDECMDEPRLEFSQGMAKGRDVRLSFRNPFDREISISGTWRLDEPTMTVDPPSVQMTLAPGSTVQRSFAFTTGTPSTIERFRSARPTFVTRTASTLFAEPVQMELELVCMQAYEVGQPKKTPSIDGDVSEWDFSSSMRLDSRAQVTLVPERWRGPEESSGTFVIARDAAYLYLAGIVKDADVIHATRKEEPYQADAVTLYLDVRDSTQFQKRYFYKDVYALVFAPPADNGDSAYVTTVYPYGSVLQGVKFGSRRVTGGYTVEAAIPLGQLGDLSRRSVAGCDVVIDNLERSGERVRMAWNGTWNDFMNATKYGLLRFRSGH